MIKPFAIAGSFLAMGAESAAATMDPENFVRYALTQGGLFALVCVLGWSYRRDLMRVSDDKTERLSVMTDLVVAATAAQTKTADSLTQSTLAIAAQAQSIQGLSSVLTRVEVALAGRRGSDGISTP